MCIQYEPDLAKIKFFPVDFLSFFTIYEVEKYVGEKPEDK
jgi:hypothetical protein